MQEQKGGQSRVKFKAQIWEINFLGPGKEKGRVEGGERGGVASSRRSVFPNGWLDKKRGIGGRAKVQLWPLQREH